jgi:hypothetical protein
MQLLPRGVQDLLLMTLQASNTNLYAASNKNRTGAVH